MVLDSIVNTHSFILVFKKAPGNYIVVPAACILSELSLFYKWNTGGLENFFSL